jgi:hypothetical protein
MRLLLSLFELFLLLPWWGSLAVIAALVAFVIGAAWYVRRQFQKIVTETILNMGAALKDAQATVHSVAAAPVPAGSSPYDLPEDDEQFAEGLDGKPWDEDEANFYLIDVTIKPADPRSAWDPTALALVPADFVPADPTYVCERLGALHSAEIFVNGKFQPAAEGEVTGPQRLRLLFAIGDDVRAVKFAKGVTYFGHVQLPAPLPKKPKLTGQR